MYIKKSWTSSGKTMRFKQYLTEEIILEEIINLLTELSMDQAIDFAEEMHKGQVRKISQKQYVVHPKAVYSILKSFGITDKITLVAAWLHDTIEDTTATYNIIKKKFNKEVADLVKQLSNSAKEIVMTGKEEYILKKMLSMDNNALTLKLADRLHNVTDIMQMSNAEKTYLQTTYILDGLKEKRPLVKVQKKIIRAIERYLNTYKP